MMIGISATSQAVVPSFVSPEKEGASQAVQVASNNVLKESDLYPIEKALLEEFKSVDKKQCNPIFRECTDRRISPENIDAEIAEVKKNSHWQNDHTLRKQVKRLEYLKEAWGDQHYGGLDADRNTLHKRELLRFIESKRNNTGPDGTSLKRE
jgi:hypothetical protein